MSDDQQKKLLKTDEAGQEQMGKEIWGTSKKRTDFEENPDENIGFRTINNVRRLV